MSKQAAWRFASWMAIALCTSIIEYTGMMRLGDLRLENWFDYVFFTFGVLSGPALAWRTFMDQSMSVYK
jgi:hypothetical protein